MITSSFKINQIIFDTQGKIVSGGGGVVVVVVGGGGGVWVWVSRVYWGVMCPCITMSFQSGYQLEQKNSLWFWRRRIFGKS